MRTAGTLSVLAVLAYALSTLVTAPVALAQGSLGMSVSSGKPGTGFSVQWTGLRVTCHNYSVQVVWDGGVVIGNGGVGWSGSGSTWAVVPSTAKPGRHQVTARTVCPSPSTASGSFTVTGGETSQQQPPPPQEEDDPKPSRTSEQAPPPAAPTTTTRPSATTTTTTTTTTSTTTATSAPPSSASEPSSAVPHGDGVLVIDKDDVQPGDPLSATGTGCTPGASVTLSSLGEQVGSTTADDAGRFSAPVEFPTAQAGRHEIRAYCGIVLVGSVNVVVSSSTGGVLPAVLGVSGVALAGGFVLLRQFRGFRRVRSGA